MLWVALFVLVINIPLFAQEQDSAWASSIEARALHTWKSDSQVRKHFQNCMEDSEADYWSGMTPLTYYVKSLKNWCQREQEGSLSKWAKQVTKNKKAIPITKPNSPSHPVVFSPQSFYSNPTAGDLLTFRNRLILSYVESLYRIELGLQHNKSIHSNDSTTGFIQDAGLMDSLYQYCAPYFHRDLQYFALQKQAPEKALWKPYTLQPTLQATFVPSCVTWDILHLRVTPPQDSNTILLAGFPKGSKSKPSGYIPLLKKTPSTIRLNCTGCDTSDFGNWITNPLSDTAWQWEIPRLTPSLNKLYVVGWHANYDGMQHLRLKLFVENNQGVSTWLGDEVFCGHSFCENAILENPYLTDANGDGLWDLVIDASDQVQYLWLQKSPGVFEKVILKPYQTHRSGGC